MEYKINEEHCLAEEYFTQIEGMAGEIYEFPYNDVIHDDLDLVDGKYVINEVRYHNLRRPLIEGNLRARRNQLLKGWDIYTSNTAFGVYQITDNEKEVMVSWYVGILNLKEVDIYNPPTIIKYLIGEKEE